MTAFITLYLFGLTVRILPVVLTRRLGSDQWYWLLYVETLKREKKLPIDLPYLLEVGQWYPPAFPLMLSILPTRWLQGYGRLIPPIVDSLHVGLVGYAGTMLTGNQLTGMIAMGIYAITPLAISYNYQLNPRGIGALALSAQFLGVYAFLTEGAFEWALLVVCLGAFTCVLHKMTTQMMVVGLVAVSAWSGSLLAAVLVPTIGLAAIALSGGFYTKVLHAHYDIVTFWNRNRDLLNAHQFDASNLYHRDCDNEALLHRPGIAGIVKHLRSFVIANPFILVVPFVVESVPDQPWSRFCFVWLATVYAWGFLTAFVPQLRCLGAGVFYSYNAALPLAILLGGAILSNALSVWATLAASVLSLVVVARESTKKRSEAGGIDEQLLTLLDHIRTLPNGNIYCIPFSLAEVTVYQTRMPVSWGGHGYGLRVLEPYFPVMQITLEEAFDRCEATYVLHDRTYVDLNRILREPETLEPIRESGRYTLYRRILRDKPSSESVTTAKVGSSP